MAGLLIAMRFVDSGFVGDVFKTAKETYTTSLISAFTAKTDSDTINIPINYNVESVADGNVVLGGGMLSLSLTDGKVEDVTENSVTVRGLRQPERRIGCKRAESGIYGRNRKIRGQHHRQPLVQGRKNHRHNGG